MSIDFIGVSVVLEVISDWRKQRQLASQDADSEQEFKNLLMAAELLERKMPPEPVQTSMPPRFGERAFLLTLSTKEERSNVLGDLAEEFTEIAAKHGERFAKVWYYKQVVASAWPMIYKVVRLGAIAWLGEWIRRIG